MTCKLDHACHSFVSVHQTAPPLTKIADIHLQLTSDLSTRRDKRLSWPGWLTYSGRFTHICGHPSATGRARDRERGKPYVPMKGGADRRFCCPQPDSSLFCEITDQGLVHCVAARLRPGLAGTRCAHPRRDGQAELRL